MSYFLNLQFTVINAQIEFWKLKILTAGMLIRTFN